MIVPSQLALKTNTNFGYAASLATLDKLVDRFPPPPVAPPIGDTSLNHLIKLGAHSIISQTPTAMGQSFIMTLSKVRWIRSRRIEWGKHVMKMSEGRVCKAKIARNYKPHRRRLTRRPPKRWNDS
jgi:hypothetical protein